MRTRLVMVLVLAMAILVGGPADAVRPALRDSGAVVADDGVLYPGCTRHEWSYSFALDDVDEAYGNFLLVDIKDAKNHFADYTQWVNVPLPSGTLWSSLCSSDADGRFSIQVNLTYTHHDGDGGGFTTAKAYFNMRDARTKTQLRASTVHPKPFSKVTFTARSAVESPSGYAKVDAVAELQQLQGKEWRKVRMLPTGDDGKVQFTVKFTGKAQYRAVTKASDEWTASKSTVVKLS